MSGIVAHVLAAQIGEVESGGIRWRIRPVTPSLVRDVTYSMLHVAIPSDEELVEERAMREWPEAERAQKEAEIAARRARAALDPERMADTMRRDQQLVCAGVTAAWNPEAGDGSGAWETLTLVMPDVEVAEGANALRIDQLAPAIVAEVAKAVWALSAGGADAVKRIANFRRGP